MTLSAPPLSTLPLSTLPLSTLPTAPSVGTRLGNYTVQQVESLPEMQGTLILLNHDNGAKHAHVIREDDNAAFNVTFPTVPKDSTGVAHILEHIVLMGSQKYPVSDPFFAMIPRSLNTFMNAMTASDWTSYPYSTRNEKDFYNLLGIYLDATFFPLMRYESFRQDGHRFEFETLDDSKSELKLQGVVYNEMKGAMASAGAVMWRAFGKALYPDLTYANNSGGNPSNIPELSHEELRAFHAAHYHPSNAYFYSYGKLPLENILGQIEDHVMSKFKAQVLDVSIPDQAPFSAPRDGQITYPSSDTERGGQVSVMWKLGLRSDAYANLRWSVLSDILLGNAAAPLTLPLINSGIGSSLADLTGYHDSFRETAFAVGLKGLSEGKTEEVQALVLDTLKAIADAGIDPALIESSLHQFEIQQKEVSNSGYPYSLQVMFRMLEPWLYGNNPLTGLRLETELTRLRADLASGPVFETMIREHLLNNNHRVTLTLVPDPALAEQTEADEKDLVRRLSANFTDEDHQRIIAESLRLKELQNQESDPDVLPTLALTDVPAQVARVAYQTEPAITKPAERGFVARVPQPTSGLSYLDVQVRLPQIPDDLLSALPLYTFAVTRSGAAGQDYVALSQHIEAVTGGIGASVGTANTPNDLNNVRLSLSFSGKALARNGNALVTLLSNIIKQPEFNRERLEQLLKQRLAGMKASVVRSGNAYAERLASSQISPTAAIDERFSGLTALETLKAIVEGDKLDELIEHFGRIQQLILAGVPYLCLTATADDVQLDLTPITSAFMGDAPVGQPHPALNLDGPQARITDSPVAFNAVAFSTIPYDHADSPALLVLSRLLRSEYLLKEIREKGGAYGGGAGYDTREGVFSMSSYRDPHMARTFEVFLNARQFLDTDLGQREVTEAILSSSKILDPLTSPDTIGRMRFYGDLAGYTPEVQEEFKARLLKVSLDDLRRVMDTYLTPERAAYGLVAGRDPNEDVKALGLKFKVKTI